MHRGVNMHDDFMMRWTPSRAALRIVCGEAPRTACTEWDSLSEVEKRACWRHMGFLGVFKCIGHCVAHLWSWETRGVVPNLFCILPQLCQEGSSTHTLWTFHRWDSGKNCLKAQTNTQWSTTLNLTVLNEETKDDKILALCSIVNFFVCLWNYFE